MRQFTETAADELFDLDGDTGIMRFLTGGKTMPSMRSATRPCPGSSAYQWRSEGLGFWAAVEKSTGEFLVWFAFYPPEGAGSYEVDSATGCAGPPGVRATLPKGLALRSARASPNSACSA